MTVQGRFALWVFCVLLFGLAGCTPEYNWREQRVAEDRAVIAFPARVQTEKRALSVNGVQLDFSLSAANVGESVFAVGYAPLAADVPAEVQAMLVKSLVESLLARAEPTQRSLLEAAALQGEVFEFETLVAKQSSLMMARVFVHRGMLIQVVVSGPKKALSNENAKEFMRSLVLK